MSNILWCACYKKMYLFCYSIVYPCQSFVRHIVFRSLFNLYMIHVLSLVLYSYTTLMPHHYINFLFFFSTLIYSSYHRIYQLSTIFPVVCSIYMYVISPHLSSSCFVAHNVHVMSIYVCYYVIIDETMTSLMRDAKCVGQNFFSSYI